MKKKKKNRNRNKNKRLSVILMSAVIGMVVAVGIILMLSSGRAPSPSLPVDSAVGFEGNIAQEPTTEADIEPYIISTAKIGSAGDILIHSPILEGAKNGDSYNFDKLFSYVKETTESYDYFVLNFETTLAGNEGRKYTTYPCFNSPDSLLDSLSLIGTDCLLTANNHSYDTGEWGFLRTVETVDAAGFDHTGTYTDLSEKRYIIENVNGINFGFICYTYETEYDSDTVKALNGLTMNKNTSPLVNSFDYDHLETFYADFEEQLENMKNDGAEVITAYMHWGDEYVLSPNSWQKKISQKLCDMGVDVIVGGHPHVVEPVSLITSTDGESKTVCIYSVGNFVSNQRREVMGRYNTGHTEDGAIFEMTFSKYSDGSVYFESVGVTPTWVHLYKENGKQVHSVVPLSDNMDASALGLNKTSGGYNNAKASYNRTMTLVGDGITECNEWLDSVETPAEKYEREN